MVLITLFETFGLSPVENNKTGVIYTFSAMKMTAMAIEVKDRYVSLLTWIADGDVGADA